MESPRAPDGPLVLSSIARSAYALLHISGANQSLRSSRFFMMYRYVDSSRCHCRRNEQDPPARVRTKTHAHARGGLRARSRRGPTADLRSA